MILVRSTTGRSCTPLTSLIDFIHIMSSTFLLGTPSITFVTCSSRLCTSPIPVSFDASAPNVVCSIRSINFSARSCLCPLLVESDTCSAQLCTFVRVSRRPVHFYHLQYLLVGFFHRKMNSFHYRFGTFVTNIFDHILTLLFLTMSWRPSAYLVNPTWSTFGQCAISSGLWYIIFQRTLTVFHSSHVVILVLPS